MTQSRLRTFGVTLGLGAVALSPVPFVLASFETVMVEQMLSQSLGTVSLMCMILTALISARPWGLDGIFGGLDKAYVVHKWLGLTALVTLVLHDTFDSEVDDLDSPMSGWGVDWGDLAGDMGSWSYDLVLILLIITFIRLIPYRWWAWTHKAMAVVCLLAVLHVLLIPKPLGLWGPGGLYLTGWSLVGLIAALLALAPASWRGGAAYEVSEITRFGGTLSMSLVPVGTGRLRHRAGQFVAVRGLSKGLTDWHPFTLSSAPRRDGTLRLTISERNRWTRRLVQTVTPGDRLLLRGPHGRFFPGRSERRQVWLSAGVGVTPHLAWAQANDTPRGPVDILHICRNRSDVPYLAELEAFAAAHEQVTLKVYETKTRGRPDARDLLRLLRDRAERVDVYFCGPEGLREELDAAMNLAQKARYTVIEEAFEFRSGLPLPGWFREALRQLREAALDLWRARRA